MAWSECSGGNCSCNGYLTCNCQSGRCGSHACACNSKCSNNCPTHNTYGCLCNNHTQPLICKAHCTSHTCNCNANLKFRNLNKIYASDIKQLYDEVQECGDRYYAGIPGHSTKNGLIKTQDVTELAGYVKRVLDKVKSLNPSFNYDYSDISSTLPSENNGSIKLATYKKMSDITAQMSTLCLSYNKCSSYCGTYSACNSNCTCNHNNQGSWGVEGWVCPCNSQCSCNKQCNSNCSNCRCNAECMGSDKYSFG